MQIDLVEVRNFRNLAPAAVRLGPGAIRVVGKNGQGKSNLLEAVHVLAQGWSPRARRGAEWIAWGEEDLLARAEGTFGGRPRRTAVSLESRGAARRAKFDERESSGLSLLLGAWPLVSFGPNDVALVQGEPETRRLWTDAFVSQCSEEGCDRLRRYRQALRQRNGYLRGCVRPDPALLEALNETLCAEGAAVVALRRELVEDLRGEFGRIYASICGGADGDASLSYRCSFGDEGGAEAFLRKLESLAPRERELKTTLAGPHRDDLEITLKGRPARAAASQGQQRSLALALQLAGGERLRRLFGEFPVLLLDDVFSELDADRRRALGELVRRADQAILAAPNPDEIPFGADRTLLVESGRITEL